MEKLGLDMDAGSVSSDNDMAHNDMSADNMMQYSMNESSASMKGLTTSANYLGRSRVFLDGHMSIDKSAGVTVIYCSYCQKTWQNPKSSSTGNYRKHLMKHHPYELSGKDGVVGQMKLRDGLLRWVVGSAIGIETFDDNFNRFLRDSFHVEIGKARLSQTIVEALDKQFENTKVKIINFFRGIVNQQSQILQNTNVPVHIAISYHQKSILSLTDSWSLIQAIPQPSSVDPLPTTYLAIAGHFINEHWQLKNIVLGFIPVRGYPSANVVASLATDVAVGQQFIDTSQITSLVASRAAGEASIDVGNSREGLSKYKVFCVGSALQAVINEVAAKYLSSNNDGATSIPSLGKLRTIVSEMNSSPKNLDIVNRLHMQISNSQQATASNNILVDYSGIDIDFPNNWRSTLKLVNTAIEHKMLIDTFSNQSRQGTYLQSRTESAQLQPDEWREIHLLSQILQGFVTVITALTNANQEMPTIPTVLPSLGWVVDFLKGLVDASSSTISPGFNHFTNTLRNGTLTLINDVKQRQIYSIASALDPRLKLEFFEDGQWTEEDKNSVVSELGSLFTHYSRLAGADQNGTEEDVSSTNFYKRRKVSSKQEWEVYLSTPVSSVEKQDPLSWWKEHSTSYPVLALLIKDIFAIPASMAFAETNLNQGIDMISRFRRQKAFIQQSRDIPLPLGQSQRPSITSHAAGLSPGTSLADQSLLAVDERIVEEIICLQSWASVVYDE